MRTLPALFVFLTLSAPLAGAAERTISTADLAGQAADEAPYVLLDDASLRELVAPIALYPDDLLAIVLPASTYPLQVVQAARYVDAHGADEKPSDDWDETVLALTNYPEALALLNEDLDWTWRLGEAVLYQEEALLKAVADYRQVARDAGNLESDNRQVVSVEDEHIRIRPANEEEIYVPYYDPDEVTEVHTTRVVHYYPTAYPVYYYPYAYGYRFPSDYFWGVSTWYSIGWSGWRLHFFDRDYRHHPYYGRRYDHHHYRAPRYRSSHHFADRRYHDGNFWRPHYRHYGARPGERAARHRYDAPRRERYSSAADRRQDRSTTRDLRRAERIHHDRQLRQRTHSPRGEQRIGRSQREINAALAGGRLAAPAHRDRRVREDAPRERVRRTAERLPPVSVPSRSVPSRSEPPRVERPRARQAEPRVRATPPQRLERPRLERPQVERPREQRPVRVAPPVRVERGSNQREHPRDRMRREVR